jgi:hypothetical protein
MSGFPKRVQDAVRLPASARTAGCVVWLSVSESRIAGGRPGISAAKHLRHV